MNLKDITYFCFVEMYVKLGISSNKIITLNENYIESFMCSYSIFEVLKTGGNC